MEVKIYARAQIEQMVAMGFPQNTAVISFCDPPVRGLCDDYAPVDYAGVCSHVFYVCIHDIDYDELEELGITYDNYFPEARPLAEFVRSAYEEGLNLICQCEHGESRSAGCVAAILEYFYKCGITIFSDYRYYPNKMIYHKMYEAFRGLGG